LINLIISPLEIAAMSVICINTEGHFHFHTIEIKNNENNVIKKRFFIISVSVLPSHTVRMLCIPQWMEQILFLLYRMEECQQHLS